MIEPAIHADVKPAPAVRAAAAGIPPLVAASAFAFGAVYPWAYWPMAVFATGIGAIGVIATGSLNRRDTAGVSMALALCAAAIGAQLVPLPPALLERISPGGTALLVRFDPAFAFARGAHPLSVDPVLTATALLLFVSLALFAVGAERLFSAAGASQAAGAIAAAGVALVVVALVQRPFYVGRLYGVWTTVDPDPTPFGPFVNRNHFAGWMVMTIPLTVGLVCGTVAHAAAGIRPTWRDRVLWIGSPAAGRAVVYAISAASLIVSVPLTLSRSGMLATTAALTMMAALISRRRTALRHRKALVAYLIVAAAGAVAFVGLDAISARLAEGEWTTIGGRVGAWQDAWAIAREFPLVGSGVNTYGVTTLFYQRNDLVHHYAQAHNDYLQLAAEGGVLVGLPVVICIAMFARTVRRRFAAETSTRAWWLRAGAVTGLVCIAIQEIFEFSLQMPANALLFAVLAAIALHHTPRRTASGRLPSLQR